jgi:hypothetical protein
VRNTCLKRSSSVTRFLSRRSDARLSNDRVVIEYNYLPFLDIVTNVESVAEKNPPGAVSSKLCNLDSFITSFSKRLDVFIAKTSNMHPFGGSTICPRCSKAVYAAEQVRS